MDSNLHVLQNQNHLFVSAQSTQIALYVENARLHEENMSLKNELKKLEEQDRQKAESLKSYMKQNEELVIANKKIAELEKDNEVLREENKLLRTKIQQLQFEMKQMHDEMKQMHDELKSVRGETNNMKEKEARREAMAVFGQIAYSFSSKVSRYVFDTNDRRHIRRKCGHWPHELYFQDIWDKADSSDQRDKVERVNNVLKKYGLDQQVDGCLERLRRDRMDIAHPATKEDGAPYTIDELKKMISMYAAPNQHDQLSSLLNALNELSISENLLDS